MRGSRVAEGRRSGGSALRLRSGQASLTDRGSANREVKSRRGEWPYSLTAWASQGRPYKRIITIHSSLFTLHYSLFTIHSSLHLLPFGRLRATPHLQGRNNSQSSASEIQGIPRACAFSNLDPASSPTNK